jgi:hypothetical protein
MAGAAPTAADIHYAAGQISLKLKMFYDDAVSMNNYLLGTSDATLIALGMTQGDVTLIKSAFADLAYQKATAFDSSTFVKQLWGLGI